MIWNKNLSNRSDHKNHYWNQLKNVIENGVEAQKLKHLEIEETIFGQINFEMK